MFFLVCCYLLDGSSLENPWFHVRALDEFDARQKMKGWGYEVSQITALES